MVVDPTPIGYCTGHAHPTPTEPTLKAPTPIAELPIGQAVPTVCMTAGAIPTVYITGVVATPTVSRTVAGL